MLKLFFRQNNAQYAHERPQRIESLATSSRFHRRCATPAILFASCFRSLYGNFATRLNTFIVSTKRLPRSQIKFAIFRYMMQRPVIILQETKITVKRNISTVLSNVAWASKLKLKHLCKNMNCARIDQGATTKEKLFLSLRPELFFSSPSICSVEHKLVAARHACTHIYILSEWRWRRDW